MEKQRNSPDMINLMICPGFCVRENQIIQVNDAAARLFLSPGMEIRPLLRTGEKEYEAFKDGCLYLTMELAGCVRGAFVSAFSDFHVFVIDQDQELRELRALALAAQELRIPLSNIMISADRIVPEVDDWKSREHRDRLDRGTSQMLRIISNMSDALRYTESSTQETRNVTSLLAELFEKASVLAEEVGISLSYTGLPEAIFMLVDTEQLERAVLNILSNAMKFTPQGGSIQVSLTKHEKLLRLTVQDSGSGIAEGVLQNIFTRYLRSPSLEDSRFGLGLGMVLIRAAAANHGGTVLIDQPGQGTRVTMTLSIRQNTGAAFRGPMLHVDYAGERDHSLLELSEVLPARLYRPEPKLK